MYTHASTAQRAATSKKNRPSRLYNLNGRKNAVILVEHKRVICPYYKRFTRFCRRFCTPQALRAFFLNGRRWARGGDVSARLSIRPAVTPGRYSCGGGHGGGAGRRAPGAGYRRGGGGCQCARCSRRRQAPGAAVAAAGRWPSCHGLLPGLAGLPPRPGLCERQIASSVLSLPWCAFFLRRQKKRLPRGNRRSLTPISTRAESSWLLFSIIPFYCQCFFFQIPAQ